MRLLDRVELGGVELLVEVGAAVVGKSVEAAMNSFKESIPREFLRSTACVIGRRPTEGIDSAGREVTFLTDQFEDTVVSRYHPLGGLSHVVHICGNGAHILPDMKYFSSNLYQSMGNLVLPNSNPEQIISNPVRNN